MQDLFLVYNIINLEILRMQDYSLNYQKKMPDIIGKYYESMKEHAEIEDYLKKMDYACYNKLISDKLISFVRKNNENVENIKKEIDYLKIVKNGIGSLIGKISVVKKRDLQVIFEEMNYDIKIDKLDENIYLYQYQDDTLSLNANIASNLEIEEFFNFYINLKYRKKSLDIKDAYNIYIKNRDNNFSLTK